MLKLVILSLSLLTVSASMVEAVVISFDPRIQILGSAIYENFSVSKDIRTSESGSGRATATANTRTLGGRAESDASLEVEVGPGAGSASASVSLISTFDMVFPAPGEYGILADMGFPTRPGEPRIGESAIAEYSLFLQVGFDESNRILLQSSEIFPCPGLLCSESFSAASDFIVTGDNILSAGPDLRLPVTMAIDFTISAIAVPEPAPIASIIFGIGSLVFIRRRRAKARGYAGG